MTPPRPDRLFLFQAPYTRILPLGKVASIRRDHRQRGAALLWSMGSRFDESLFRAIRWRPAGVPLVVITPPASEIETDAELLRVLEHCRPVALVPFHEEPDPIDMRILIAEPPDDLAAAVVDYFVWRGLVLDIDTRRLLRRTIEMSGEIRTVAGLARGVYLSRRALGRKFLAEGLPVPSHWLHFARLLRAVVQIQTRDDPLMSIAYRLGYPDAFALSNQMKRLTGIRPSEVRDLLGWEWFAESWIEEEVRTGGFSEDAVAFLFARGAVARPVDEEDEGGGPPTPLPSAAAGIA